MSVQVTVVYPPVKKYKAGTGPCPELELDYLYSDQDKKWLVQGNVYVEKRRTKTTPEPGFTQETLEVEV
jgi:hypothetical protein